MFGLAAIGSAVGKIFGTDKALTSVIDGTKSALDKLVYTSEEKADDNAASVTEARAMVIDWLKNTQGQNLARRLIALVVTGMWALNLGVVQMLSVVSVWLTDIQSEKCIEAANIVSETGQSLTSAMMLVLAFYFAAPQMGKFADVALKRFGGEVKGSDK